MKLNKIFVKSLINTFTNIYYLIIQNRISEKVKEGPGHFAEEGKQTMNLWEVRVRRQKRGFTKKSLVKGDKSTDLCRLYICSWLSLVLNKSHQSVFVLVNDKM